MDWANERYVRLYTRDTADMVAVGWEGRAVLAELLRKVDRSGVLEHGGEAELVPEMLRIPSDLFLTGFARLIKRGVIKATETAIILPNFMEAQDCAQSDAARKRAERERRRAEAMSHGVTPSHAESHEVTPCLAVPSRAVPVPKSKKHATHIPDDWKPNTEHEALATEQGVDARQEAARFRDWALANGRTYVRWDAGFSNWLRNANRYGGGVASKPKKSQTNIAALLDAAHAEAER